MFSQINWSDARQGFHRWRRLCCTTPPSILRLITRSDNYCIRPACSTAKCVGCQKRWTEDDKIPKPVVGSPDTVSLRVSTEHNFLEIARATRFFGHSHLLLNALRI